MSRVEHFAVCGAGPVDASAAVRTSAVITLRHLASDGIHESLAATPVETLDRLEGKDGALHAAARLQRDLPTAGRGPSAPAPTRRRPT